MACAWLSNRHLDNRMEYTSAYAQRIRERKGESGKQEGVFEAAQAPAGRERADRIHRMDAESR